MFILELLGVIGLGILLVVVLAGGASAMVATMMGVSVLLKENVPLSDFGLTVAVAVVSNLICHILFRKIWRSPREWTFFGLRRLGWQLLLPPIWLTGAAVAAYVGIFTD